MEARFIPRWEIENLPNPAEYGKMQNWILLWEMINEKDKISKD
jgi:hypothetical protein